MKKLNPLLLSMLILCSITACSFSRNIRFGTAGIGGNYYLFGETFSEVLSNETNLQFEVKETAGSAANLRLLDENYVQIAIAQTDLIEESLKSGSKEYYALASLYTDYCQIVVKDSSSIKSVTDLLGKTVSIGESESGTELNARQILEAYGISDNLLKTENMNYTDASEALKNGKIDAMFITAGIRTSVIEHLAQDISVRFLPIEGNALTILMNSYDFYEAQTIPAATYSGQKEDIPTVGVKSILLVNDHISEETAYTITKELFNHASDLQNAMPVSLELTLEGITIPIHSGAEKYFNEEGIEIPQGM